MDTDCKNDSKRLVVELPATQHVRLRTLCAARGETLKHFVGEALDSHEARVLRSMRSETES